MRRDYIYLQILHFLLLIIHNFRLIKYKGIHKAILSICDANFVPFFRILVIRKLIFLPLGWFIITNLIKIVLFHLIWSNLYILMLIKTIFHLQIDTIILLKSIIYTFRWYKRRRIRTFSPLMSHLFHTNWLLGLYIHSLFLL